MNNVVRYRHSGYERLAGGLAILVVQFAMADVSLGAEPFYGPFVLEGATIHGDQVVFACGGQLWRVANTGGTAQAITSGAAHDSMPRFSPDGAQLAFLRRSERLSGRAPASPDDPLPT